MYIITLPPPGQMMFYQIRIRYGQKVRIFIILGHDLPSNMVKHMSCAIGWMKDICDCMTVSTIIRSL